MTEFSSYVSGRFHPGAGDPVPQLNPATEEIVASARCGGVDLAAALAHARDVGIPSLLGMTFPERAAMLGRMAAVIHEHRDQLIESSVLNNGATRSGAKFDVDGASQTLAAYAALGKDLGEGGHLADGDGVGLGQGARLMGRHVFVPRRGVAVFINAFNFPAWGFAEKAATALLAGMPVINKPATATSFTAGRLAEVLVAAEALPPGAFSQVLGPVAELLDGLGPQDVVAFTGSSKTAVRIRSLSSLSARSVPVNVEADSLNAAVLGTDVDPDSDCYRLFLRDVTREISEKSGQKCTATRRVLVPEDLLERVAGDLTERLAGLKVGNPSTQGVEVGPLATAQQRDDVLAGYSRLASACERIFGADRPAELVDVPEGKGFFAGPSLFVARGEAGLAEAHGEEVFGPAACLLPYDGTSAEAIDLVRRGGGMLVSSVYSDRRAFLREVAFGIAPYCGRVVLVDSRSEGHSLPTGMVLPALIHGGPGRAGGGEELGGLRGVHHYMHRAALQGNRGLIEKLTSIE